MQKKTVDQYIADASEVTQPILAHLRDLIKKAHPEIEENIKWNAPSFEINGKIVCALMGFKNHVNFIFTNGKDLEDPEQILTDIGAKSNMRGIKTIKKITEVPNESILIAYIKVAVEQTK